MSVSRDFIDSYSPEARNPGTTESWNPGIPEPQLAARTGPKESRRGPDQPALWEHNVSFRFLYRPGFAQGVDILGRGWSPLPSPGPGSPPAAGGDGWPRRPPG